jgi:hypothetical protein
MDSVTTTIDWVGGRNVVVIKRNGQPVTSIDLADWLKLPAVRYAAELLQEKAEERAEAAF